jgi:hypothetical protein
LFAGLQNFVSKIVEIGNKTTQQVVDVTTLSEFFFGGKVENRSVSNSDLPTLTPTNDSEKQNLLCFLTKSVTRLPLTPYFSVADVDNLTSTYSPVFPFLRIE